MKSKFEQAIDDVIEETIVKQIDNPLTDLCLKLEHYVTPAWTAEAILDREILTQSVLDPCCGTGVLAEAARGRGYDVVAFDVHNWGYKNQIDTRDFLTHPLHGTGFSVFMNPPFSLAMDFVERSFDLGARKILCFQRFAWYESAERRAFFEKFPPVRVYTCGNRADCWRHDIPVDEKGRRFDPKTGKRLNGTTTAHAWFVFERGYRGSTTLDRVYKPEKPLT